MTGSRFLAREEPEEAEVDKGGFKENDWYGDDWETCPGLAVVFLGDSKGELGGNLMRIERS